MTNLEGKVVVVTGGNSGIGFGMAEGCAKAGADIAVWSRRADRNAEACEKLAKHGVRAVGMVCDVGDGWTVVTKDHSLSAQYEHTILVTDSGFEVLTVSDGCPPPPN